MRHAGMGGAPSASADLGQQCSIGAKAAPAASELRLGTVYVSVARDGVPRGDANIARLLGIEDLTRGRHGRLLAAIRHERLVEILVLRGKPGFYVKSLIDRFQEHAAPDPTPPYLRARHAELLRQAYGLTASVPKEPTADWNLAAICIWAAESPRDLSRLSHSSEFWMSGFVASFRSGGVLRTSRRSGGVLRPSRRSCTVAERDGPPKGKSPVLPLPEQAASKVPKNMTTKRCNMTRDAPSGAVPWRARARESNQPSKLAAASTTPVTNAAVLKNRKMSLRTFAIVASPSGFFWRAISAPQYLDQNVTSG